VSCSNKPPDRPGFDLVSLDGLVGELSFSAEVSKGLSAAIAGELMQNKLEARTTMAQPIARDTERIQWHFIVMNSASNPASKAIGGHRTRRKRTGQNPSLG
jgi:hypothetical protein